MQGGQSQPQIGEYVLKDSTTTHILDPVFAGDAVKFMALQAQWLGKFIINKDYEAFNFIPESVVYDLGSWLVFVINQVRAAHAVCCRCDDYSYILWKQYHDQISLIAGLCIAVW